MEVLKFEARYENDRFYTLLPETIMGVLIPFLPVNVIMSNAVWLGEIFGEMEEKDSTCYGDLIISRIQISDENSSLLKRNFPNFFYDFFEKQESLLDERDKKKEEALFNVLLEEYEEDMYGKLNFIATRFKEFLEKKHPISEYSRLIIKTEDLKQIKALLEENNLHFSM